MTDSGVGKDPSDVDAEAPSDDAVMEHLGFDVDAEPETNGSTTDASRDELWQVIEEQQKQIETLTERVDSLEQQVEDVEYEADTMQEVAEKFRDGQIGGPAGEDFLREFVSVPEKTNSLLDARATKLFFRIVRNRRVDKPVLSKDVVEWLEFHDSSNPSVRAKRVMDRLKRLVEDGYFIGEVELGKYRGRNCLWLRRT